MKKLLFCFALTLIVFNLSAQEDADTTNLELLFVQNADKISYSDGLLILKKVGPTTLFFTDRPVRIAGHMTTADFVEDWDVGENSFAENPPNAVISIFNGDEVTDVALVLKDPILSGKNMTYAVDILDGTMPATGKECSLFIDPVGVPISPTSVAGVHRRQHRRHSAIRH
jgi:hypothetical protein